MIVNSKYKKFISADDNFLLAVAKKLAKRTFVNDMAGTVYHATVFPYNLLSSTINARILGFALGLKFSQYKRIHNQQAGIKDFFHDHYKWICNCRHYRLERKDIFEGIKKILGSEVCSDKIASEIYAYSL